jgi:hypothetical protein
MNATARLSRRCVLCVAVLAASACSTNDGTVPSSFLIPNDTLNISKSVSIPLESLAAGAILYVIIDPLAPNWKIEQTQLGANRYLIALKKKRFTTGGDGEAGQIFNRRAAQIARDNGGGVYRIVEFTEGVESTVPIAQRVAQGVVEIEQLQAR